MFYSTWSNFFHDDFKTHGKRVFLEHYDTVRALVPKERLLEYQAKDGWDRCVRFWMLRSPRWGFLWVMMQVILRRC